MNIFFLGGSIILFSSILVQFVSCELPSTNDSPIGIRKDIMELTRAEKDEVLSALYIMKEERSRYNASWSAWDYFAYVHRTAFFETSTVHGHESWAFFPWHRAFSYLLEQEMQYYLNNPSFRLPYWDASNPVSTRETVLDTTFLGGNGSADSEPPWILPLDAALGCNHFTIDPMLYYNFSNGGLPVWPNYTCLARQIGVFRAMPPAEEWQNVIDAGLAYGVEPYYEYLVEANESIVFADSFRARIEATPGLPCQEDENGNVLAVCPWLHSGLHGYIGGHVLTPPSTVDPLFFMLHNWVDAMWALYQDKYGIDHTFPKRFLEVPYFDGLWFNNSQMNALDVMDHRNSLRYAYSLQQSADDNGKKKTDDEWFLEWIYIGVGAALFLVIVVTIGCCVYHRRQKPREQMYNQFKYDPNF